MAEPLYHSLDGSEQGLRPLASNNNTNNVHLSEPGKNRSNDVRSVKPYADIDKPLPALPDLSADLHRFFNTPEINGRNIGKYAYSPLINDDFESINDEATGLSDHKTARRLDPCEPAQVELSSRKATLPTWLPYALRRPFLLYLLALILALFGVVVSLHLYSRRNMGLIDDTGQPLLFFGWRFAPTVVAVLYSLLCTMLLEDVKRTEAWARMTKSTTAPTKATVLQKSGAWWNALADGFSRSKNHNTYSWALLCSTICMLIASLAVSPLSASLLFPAEVRISNFTTFNRWQPDAPLGFATNNPGLPRFRSIAHLLQKVETSVWVTDNFTVLPVWPLEWSSPRFGPDLGLSSAVWQAETTVFQTELRCRSLRLGSFGWANLDFQRKNASKLSNLRNMSISSEIAPLITLSSNDGCNISLVIANQSGVVTLGGGSWARMGQLAVAKDDVLERPSRTGKDQTALAGFVDSTNAPVNVSASAKCLGSELMFMTDAWLVADQQDRLIQNRDMRAVGYVCDNIYHSADITVAVEIDAQHSTVTFNQTDFQMRRRRVDSSVMNLDTFEDAFLSANWSHHLVEPSASQNDVKQRPCSGGPASVMAAMYNFSMSDAINDGDFVSRATALKQRYLGEVLILSLSQQALQPKRAIGGQIVTVRERIVVSQVVAFTLEALLVMEILLVLIIVQVVRLENRTLGLHSDPAKVSTIAKLVLNNTSLAHAFNSLGNKTQKQTYQQLVNHSFRLTLDPDVGTSRLRLATKDEKVGQNDSSTGFNEGLGLSSHAASEFIDHNVDSGWRPAVMRSWTIALLALFLALALAAIAVLHRLSENGGLYHKALVYETRIVISNVLFSTVAPYSIIPTLIAVGFSLWWGAMDYEFRALQPFLAMTQRPTIFADGLELSYQSCYLIWAAIKAAMHKHWLLSLICTGSCVAQIMTIAMSAIWTSQHGQRTMSVVQQRTRELRTAPYMFGATVVSEDMFTLNLYKDLQTNWLYGAIIQATLNGTQPAWSSSGWNFVPIDLTKLDLIGSGNQTEYNHDHTKTWSFGRNVTFQTQAMRGQLSCTSYADFYDEVCWLDAHDFTNTTLYNTSAFPRELTSGYTLGCNELSRVEAYYQEANQTGPPTIQRSSILSGPSTPWCCKSAANSTDEAVIAYWSEADLGTKSPNLTVRWIHGEPVGLFPVYTELYAASQRLVFSTPPRMEALNCRPVIQQANASVTVDQASGTVLHYKIVDDIKEDPSPWDFYWQLYNCSNLLVDPDACQIAVSYGVLFREALLRAADIGRIKAGDVPNWPPEDLGDTTFNFRQVGLNMDYMSYAMYSLAGRNKAALLGSKALAAYANEAFALFFQHFVSSRTTSQNGTLEGWAYQPLGTKRPPPDEISQASPYYEIVDRPPLELSPEIEVQVTYDIKQLRVNYVALWLCVFALAWLLGTALIVAVSKNLYLSKMRRGVGTIADVTILIAGSRALLSYLSKVRREDDYDRRRFDAGAAARTRLGWFRDQNGHPRWGIELYGFGGKYAVEWLKGPPDHSDHRKEQHGRRQKDRSVGFELTSLTNRRALWHGRGQQYKKLKTQPLITISQVDQ